MEQQVGRKTSIRCRMWQTLQNRMEESAEEKEHSVFFKESRKAYV